MWENRTRKKLIQREIKGGLKAKTSGSRRKHSRRKISEMCKNLRKKTQQYERISLAPEQTRVQIRIRLERATM